MNEGTDPGEAADDEFVNRRAAALHEEAARLAERERALDERSEQLEQWTVERVSLFQRSADLLTTIVRSQQETARRLMRLDDRLAELEQRYPDARSDLPSCRIELMAENRRLITHAESVQQTAALFAAEPDAEPEEPDGTASPQPAAGASTPSEPEKQPAADDTHFGSLPLVLLTSFGLVVLGVARMFIHPVPDWMFFAYGMLSGIVLGVFLEWLVGHLHHTRDQRARK